VQAIVPVRNDRALSFSAGATMPRGRRGGLSKARSRICHGTRIIEQINEAFSRRFRVAFAMLLPLHK
jgi:hypothetical protein